MTSTRPRPASWPQGRSGGQPQPARSPDQPGSARGPTPSLHTCTQNRFYFSFSFLSLRDSVADPDPVGSEPFWSDPDPIKSSGSDKIVRIRPNNKYINRYF